MIRIEDKSMCCGCTACYAICPHDAIEMTADPLGFKYPEVDMDRCVDCGLCEKVCVFSKASQHRKEPVRCMAMRHNDKDELLSSRSGAVFPALAEVVLKHGGSIYGAAFTEDFMVAHKRGTDTRACRNFRGSKYVQSDMGNTFRMALRDLQSGVPVLFSGTPCQTAALDSYVPDRFRDKLYLVDIVCHGVPSPSVWRDNLKYQSGRLGAPLTEVSFRDKRMFGWTSHVETYRSGPAVVSDDMFTTLFYENVMLRESCHVCPYASVKRSSDVTLADFWGWQKVLPDEFGSDDRGVSLVLANTDKGLKLIDTIEGSFTSAEVELKDCLQPNLLQPTPCGKSRNRFVRTYTRKGFHKAAARYDKRNLRNRINLLYLEVRKKLRRTLGL